MHFLLFFILGFSQYSVPTSEQSQVNYAQFQIITVSSAEAAEKIDEKLKKKKGILSTHTDHVTSTFFCTYSSEASYNEDNFTGWFKRLGYQIDCFNSGSQGDGKMLSPHELNECYKRNLEEQN